MANESRHRVVAKTFLGMTTDADRHDAPPGLAVKSVNVESHDPGVLRTRRGYREVTFEE